MEAQAAHAECYRQHKEQADKADKNCNNECVEEHPREVHHIRFRKQLHIIVYRIFSREEGILGSPLVCVEAFQEYPDYRQYPDDPHHCEEQMREDIKDDPSRPLVLQP